MEHVRGIKIQEAVSLWREIDTKRENESYHALRSKISRAAEKGIIDTAWFSGDGYKLYKNTDVVKFAKSLIKSETVANCNQTEQPTSDCSQLPKLTAEVFDRPDCPEWAKWAAVDADRCGFYYEDKPRACEANGEWLVDKCVVGTNRIITGYFDPTNWQNSLIERPTKLPDWCKVGEWVYLSNAKYYKIKKVDSYGIILADGTVIKTDDIHAEAVSARLRPYNANEMRGLIGKVLTSNSCSTPFSFLVVYAEGDGSFIESYRFKYTAEELKDHFTIDGNPCGVQEHRENGEWVK